MTGGAPDPLILSTRIAPEALAERVTYFFDDMVKYVADIERGIVAIGADMHADLEAVLIADGSRQSDLWGANYLPGRGRDDCIEYTSLINIRPSQGNPAMTVEDPAIRERIREVTFELIGHGEAL